MLKDLNLNTVGKQMAFHLPTTDKIIENPTGGVVETTFQNLSRVKSTETKQQNREEEREKLYKTVNTKLQSWWEIVDWELANDRCMHLAHTRTHTHTV